MTEEAYPQGRHRFVVWKEVWPNLLVPQDKALPTSYKTSLVLILKKEDESRSAHSMRSVWVREAVKSVDSIVRTCGLNPSSAMV